MRPEKRPEPPTVEVVRPSCQPSRSGLHEVLCKGSSLWDFKRATKALVRPVRARYVKRPKRRWAANVGIARPGLANSVELPCSARIPAGQRTPEGSLSDLQPPRGSYTAFM